MSCPTCDHTMQKVGVFDDNGPTFWCPRCGTLRVDTQAGEFVDRPKLVDRCREFGGKMNCAADWTIWVMIGVEESIFVPGERREEKWSHGA